MSLPAGDFSRRQRDDMRGGAGGCSLIFGGLLFPIWKDEGRQGLLYLLAMRFVLGGEL